jgi:glycosyltransferase involved in cell wall biosynthesis
MRTNGVLLREIVQFRPTHLYTMSPDWMNYTAPVLFLTRIPLIYLMGDSPRVSRPLFRLLWKWHAARISTLVTVSDFILNQVRENAFDTTKSRRIYHSPPGMLSDPPNSKPDQVRLLVKYDEDGANKQTESVLQYEPGLLTVAYVGQIAKAKGVHLLVEAALSLLSRGAQIRFLIAGDYSYNNPFAWQLKSRVEREIASGRIQFLGFVTNRDDVFQLADLHVCPSLWQEPFGLTVLEAKWAGIPSIIFANGGLAETVVHGHNGWVCESQTATGLETAMRFYLDHPDARSKQGKAAQATVTGNGCFGVKQFFREWTDVFETTG